MRLTIAPASTKTAASTIQSLLHLVDNSTEQSMSLEIHAIYRDIAKVPKEFTSRSNFRAVVGDVSVAATLDFRGSDAVLAVTPPVYDGRDIVAHAEKVSRNVAEAVQRSGSVKRVVLLSSVGAQFSEKVGEIKTNNIAENIFSSMAYDNKTSVASVPELVFVRCAFFMENWVTSLETIKESKPFFYSTITPLDWRVPMVATRDIGRALATELTKPFRSSPSLSPLSSSSTSSSSLRFSPYVYELHGPQSYSPKDVQAAFSEALSGKYVEVKPVDRHELNAFYSNVFPPQIVGSWVEMATSFLPGGVMAPDKADRDHRLVVRGATDLRSAIKAAVDHDHGLQGGASQPAASTTREVEI